MGAALGILAKYILPIAIPMILPSLMKAGAGMAQKGVMARQMANLGRTAEVVPGFGGIGKQIMSMDPNTGAPIFSKIAGGGFGKVANIAGAVGSVMPYILSMAGRATQAAGKAAGGAAKIAGAIPAGLAQIGNSPAHRNQFGGSILDGLGHIGTVAGGAADEVLTGAGNALGAGIGEAAQGWKMKQLMGNNMAQMGDIGNMIRGMGLDPSNAQLMARIVSMMAGGTHPHAYGGTAGYI